MAKTTKTAQAAPAMDMAAMQQMFMQFMAQQAPTAETPKATKAAKAAPAKAGKAKAAIKGHDLFLKLQALKEGTEESATSTGRMRITAFCEDGYIISVMTDKS